jgi:hypothetical protein
MSPLTIIGLVWLGFGLLTIAIAVWKKLNVVPWIVGGPIFGFVGVFMVLAQAGAKTGSWSADGSTYYGAAYGAGGLGFSGGHHGGGGCDSGHGGYGGFC